MTPKPVEELESQLEDAAQELQDALHHQQAAYEGRLTHLRSVIHDLAGAFSRLNCSADVAYRRPTDASRAQLEVDRVAAYEKFNNALDRIR